MDSAVPLLLFFIAIPLSMLMWAGNLAFSFIKPGTDEVIPPTRWLLAVLLPLVIAARGLKKKSVSRSGALLGFVVGFILTLANYCFLACLITFFFSSSKSTKFRSKEKARLEKDFKEGGQRNWLQVLCNGGMASQLAVMYILDVGIGQRPINFIDNYRASWLAMGVMGALSCCNGDTWASELGTVLSKSDPFLITTWKRVPKGVNGGVSFVGLLVSLLGGLAIGLTYFISLYFTVDRNTWNEAPLQWPIIILGGLAGFFGSLVDSILGATVQYSGIDKETGVIVEHPGPSVRHICGKRILDNHSVNILSSILTGLFIPWISNMVWVEIS